MFYSAETGGFYHPNIHRNIPVDSIEVTPKRHTELLDGVGKGQVIVVTAGNIQLAAPPLPTSGQLMADLRKQRDRLLSKSDWTQMQDAPLTEPQRTAWADYRQALRDLPQTITDPADVTWPASPIGI